MDPTGIGIFQLAERRLAWTDQRQRLLAQNVANANTPGFQPQDLPAFQGALSPVLARTSARHLAPGGHDEAGAPHRSKARTIAGNGISLEDQLVRVADTAAIQELSLNLHRRYAAMVRTAFGRPG